MARKPRVGWKTILRKTLRASDAHYSGGLVAGAKILEFFGDAATLLCLRESSGQDEGLFRAYESVDFLKPVYSKDSLIITASIIHVGNRSRKISFIAKKTKPRGEVVAKAVGTVVVKQGIGS